MSNPWGDQPGAAAWAPQSPTPPAPAAEPPPRRRRWPLLAGLGGIVVAVVAGGGAYLLLHHDGPSYPKAWDPRIAPLAAEAAKLRHLDFKHPIHVEFLTPAAYSKKSAGDDTEASLSAKDKQDMADAVGQFRAVGLLQGTVDLFQAGKTLADSGTLAFYSSKDKRAYIRGTKLTVDLRVTLVHELTHALQDQNFGLDKVYGKVDKAKGDSLAPRALIEGDAKIVEGEYVDGLSKADRAAYDKAQQSEGDAAGVAKVKKLPKVLLDAFSAPYEFGPELVKVLKDTGGEAAVDHAFEDPPASFAEVWNPFVYLAGQKPVEVARPDLPTSAKKLDDGPFGSFVMYLVLAGREPALTALDAADAWRGDSSIVYKIGGRVCVDLHVRAADEAGAAKLLAAWRRWRGAMPGGQATVTRAPQGVDVHACDPGVKLDLKVTDAADKALAFPVGRLQAATEVIASAKKPGSAVTISPAAAYCYSDRVIRLIPAKVLLDNTPGWQPDAALARRIQQTIFACMRQHP